MTKYTLEWVREALVSRDPEHLKKIYDLFRTEDHYILMALAGNSNTPVDVMEKIASAGIIAPNVKIRLMDNLFFNGFDILLEDTNQLVRETLASHARTPIEVLRELVKDEDASIRSRVVSNPVFLKAEGSKMDGLIEKFTELLLSQKIEYAPEVAASLITHRVHSKLRQNL